jgi:hypothetical protein
MVDKQHFDFNTREPQVRAAMAWLVSVCGYGGYEGGLPVAVFDFQQKLSTWGYGEQYIKDAAASCEREGNRCWHKVHGGR